MAVESAYNYIDENRKSILDLYNKHQTNLVTIPKGRGKKLGEGWAKWQTDQFTEDIPNDCDFAVMCGITSDGITVLDFEVKNVSEEQRESILLPIMEEVFPNAKNETLVIKTGNGYHIYFKTTGHILNSKDFKKNGITIEIKGQGKYVVGASSKHYDQDENGDYFLSGKVYKIISNVTIIKKLDAEKFIQSLLDKSWNYGSRTKDVSELYSQLSQKGEGSNRQSDLIRILVSIIVKNPNFDYADITYFAHKINSQFKVSYPKNIIKEKIKGSWIYGQEILEKKTEQILTDDEVFSKLWNKTPGDQAEIGKTTMALVKLCIKTAHMVVKSEIRQKILEWLNLHNVTVLQSVRKNIKIIIDTVFSDNKTFPIIKQICHDLGERQKPIVFDQDQITETGEWLKGRYNIKKIELNGELLHFNERHYEKDSKEFIRRQASECLVKQTNNSCNEVVGYVERTANIIKGDDIEKFVHLKCLNNGIYNIKTGEFSLKFSPEYIILNQIPHNFDENVKFDTISKRVREIIIDEKDRQSCYDFASICLHPYTGIDFQLGFVGIAGTGKSQLTILFKKTLGAKNVNHASIHDIARDMTIQQDAAYYFLNIDEEGSSDDIRNINPLKKWITQNEFTGRSIYAHSSTYRPTTRLMFVTNGVFEITNHDDALAIYERTHLLKLNQKFRDTEREKKNIFERIDESEFDGFITYLLKNATEIYENQKIHYPQKTHTTETLWNEYGNNIHKFIDTWIEKGARCKTQSSEIWSKWLNYAIVKKIPPKGRNQFYAKFDEIIGSSSIKIKDGDSGYWGYPGLRLRTNDEVTIQEKIDETRIGKILKRIQKLDEYDSRLDEIERLVK